MKLLSQVSDHIIVKDKDNDGSECIYVSICVLSSLLVYSMLPRMAWLMTITIARSVDCLVRILQR